MNPRPTVYETENLRFLHFPLENVDWEGFKAYLLRKYRRKQWALELWRTAKKHQGLIANLSMLDSAGKSNSAKAKVLQSLIALSKHQGFYEEFKAKMKAHGVKWHKPSSLEAFLRIRNNSNGDVLEWVKEASDVLGDSKVFLEFALRSGLRTSEAIESFNLIIKLHQENRLSEYFNEELSTLEHFAYPKTFLRNTKNAFISIMPKDFIMKICQCEPITYSSIKMKLQRKHLPLRMGELRDYFSTFMAQHGLIREEVDLLQGRIGESIFTRHYFSPSFQELKTRTLKAIADLKVIS